MTDRQTAAQEFLGACGWGAAQRAYLSGDASDRSYDRLWQNGKTAVLMDAPPGKGDDPADFIRIADYLRGIGLSAPAIYARDLAQGFLLIEDLGDDLFARLLQVDPAREVALYSAAAGVLRHLHRHPPPAGLPDLSAADWAEAAAFAYDWYARAVTGRVPARRDQFTAVLAAALVAHADGPRVMIMRDYHAENLLDLPGREGMARVGLLDFQLAQMGQPAYDLVSLIQDARRDVSASAAQAAVAVFARDRGESAEDLDRSIAILGAQRALRILGIFARLCPVAGKPGYVEKIPRVWGQLQANLRHPALAELRALCEADLPPPTPAALERIKEQCAKTSP